MGQSVVKNPKKLYSQLGGDPTLPSRVTNLENNEYKVTYYEIISGASGSLTLPTGATINAGEFGLSGNCILSKIDGSNKPTFESPKTSGGTIVTASLNETTGAWVASGTYTDSDVALIYSIKIKAVNYGNLDYDFIIETSDTGVAHLDSPTFTGTVTTPAIIVSSETASRVAIIDASKNVKSADTTTYPSLTELSYGKGVTSAIQTQLDNKGTFQPIYSGKYKTIPFSGIPGSSAGWSGVILYIPIPINETQTFTAIRQEVTVAAAASNIRLAVYSDNNGLPDSRLDDSGNLSSATTGSKDYTLSSPITVNASSKQIWVAIQVSSNVLQLRYILNSICLNYLNGSGIQTALYIQAQAFGAFPATATPVIYSNANAPLVSLLMQ